jgi:C1A family cysteine protease
MKSVLLLLTIIVLSFFGFSQNGMLPIPDFDAIEVSGYLPIAYDLRGIGRLSPVKAQPSGGCWASASMGAVESVWRTYGFGKYTLSDKNLQIFNGFDTLRRTNGNHYMATAYFTRGSGPLLKTKEADSLSNPGQKILAYITDARYLPDDPVLIKQTIMDYGAVYSMLYYKAKFLDTLTYTYSTRIEKINHAVNLVGWNDTMQTQNGRGAWIAQNSMGKKFGEKGFFYISYADTNILNYNAIWPKWIPYDSTSSIYYYDTLGATIPFGYYDTICCGLVKYTAKEDLQIKKIGTSITSPGTKVTSYIYGNFKESSKRLVKQKAVFEEKECKMAGYYSFDLKEPVHVKKGEAFYIMMQYVTPNDSFPLPTEKFLKNYANPHITNGKCWVNANVNRWPNAWNECGADVEYETLRFDLCIKAYCVRASRKK